MDYPFLCFVILTGLEFCRNHVNAKEVCEDTLNGNKLYKVLDNEGKIIAEIDNCRALKRQFPHLCELTEDNKLPWEVPTGGNGGVCCKTCGDPFCLDKLTKRNTMPVVGKDISDCSVLAADYPVRCIYEGKLKARCCQACKNVDTSCVDELRTFAPDTMCPGYINENPCRCEREELRKLCCASCAKYNNECGCRDVLDDSDPAIISLTEVIGGKTIVHKRKIKSCKVIKKFYAQFCSEGSFGGEGKRCCKSCQGVDPNCKDSIGWRATVKDDTKKECVDCTCRQIRRKGKALMQVACQRNIKGNNLKMTTRKACCLQCKRLGFDV